MIVHTLKMCTRDAGPEQSLVLFPPEIIMLTYNCQFHEAQNALNWDETKVFIENKWERMTKKKKMVIYISGR